MNKLKTNMSALSAKRQ